MNTPQAKKRNRNRPKEEEAEIKRNTEKNLTKQNPKGILFIYLRVFTASNILRSLANNLHHLLA